MAKKLKIPTTQETALEASKRQLRALRAGQKAINIGNTVATAVSALGPSLINVSRINNPVQTPLDLNTLQPQVVDPYVSPTDLPSVFAFGGTVPTEVEGGEVIQTPEGQAAEIQGPRHEQGGVHAQLPPGTQVYSDRLHILGETIAERKKQRLAEIAKIEEKLKKRPNDAVLLSTLKRLKSIDKYLSAHEMQAQEQLKQQLTLQTPVQKFAKGGVVKSLEAFNRYATPGDYLQLWNIVQSLNNIGTETQLNRLQDTAHTNYFEDVSKRAEDTLEKSKEVIDAAISQTQQQARLSATAASNTVNRNAMSVNTLQAMNIGLYNNLMNSLARTQLQGASNKAAVDKSLASIQIRGDSLAAQGATKADELTRADTDNYFSQAAIDRMNKLWAQQHLAKTLNAIQERNVREAMWSQYGKYITVDPRTGAYKLKEGALEQAMADVNILSEARQYYNIKPEYWAKLDPAAKKAYVAQYLLDRSGSPGYQGNTVVDQKIRDNQDTTN